MLMIHHFLPPSLLEHFDPETICFDEFMDYVAKARFVQELREDMLVRAICKVFGAE